MYWLAEMMFRTSRALLGTSIPSAFSTARTDANAWTIVQTAQIRCVQIHASRGSRLRTISSMPRNMVPELHASDTFPPSTCASMRKCPSMRVTGSTTTRAIETSYIVVLFRLFRQGVFGALFRTHEAPLGMRRGKRSNSTYHAPSDLFRANIYSETRHLWQWFVERRHSVPEAVRRAGDTAVPRLYRPTRSAIPANGGAVVRGVRPLAAHLVKTPSFTAALVSPFLHEFSSVVVGTAFALVVDDLPIGEKRSIVPVEWSHFVERQVMTKTASVFATLCGHPPRFTTFVPGTASWSPSAPVGLGSAPTSPPSHAHAPTAILAAACVQTSRAISSAVRPPIVQYTPSSAVGIEPSTTVIYFPRCCFTTRSSTASACFPAPAIIVSWYSHESSSSTMSATVGSDERSMDSVFPAQS